MSLSSKLKLPILWPLLLLLPANGLILFQSIPHLRYGAALVLLAFLPGWAWLNVCRPHALNQVKRVALSVGLSLALTIFGAMAAVYLPGPLTLTHLLITINAIIMAGLIFNRWTNYTAAATRVNTTVMLLLAALLLPALFLRLPRLGYAEFHEDEAEALMLGVRLFQGEDYALFLHRKGPAQMLVPVAFWLLTGQITETFARFPFALSSVFSVVTLFLTGRRWFNRRAGIIAGLLWAVNGYAIAFARMVQYQALIFFMGILAIYCLYLAWEQRQFRYQILAMILLAAGLLAHFDALLLLPAAGYLLWANFRGAQSTKNRFLNLGLSLTLFIALLASFYIPYVLDPEFQHTTTYLTESRVKPGLLYNNLDLLRHLDRDYSSRFYLPLLAVGLLGFVFLANGRTTQGGRGAGAQQSGQNYAIRNTQYASRTPALTQKGAGAGITHHAVRITILALIASTIWFPSVWQAGQFNLAALPWLLLLIVEFFTAPDVATRTAWLLFGAPLIGYVFLVDDPRTHLYIVYPGAVLLAGTGWVAILNLRKSESANLRESELPASPAVATMQKILFAVCAVVILAVAIYEGIIFLQTESAFAETRAQWAGSLAEMVYNDMPTARKYFGYPKYEGWKAIGALRAGGHFPGDFRSVNEDFIVPIWYNYGQARSCYNTPAHFFARLAGLDESTGKAGYIDVGQVARENEVRIRISSHESIAQNQFETYTAENFIAAFDALTTPQQFAQQSEPATPVGTQFGSIIEFTGYDLPRSSIKAGETLFLNLYWRALENPAADYRAFVHLTDGATLWAQQDDNPACRLPTSIWRVGQRGLGQFRLQVNPDTPPGRYPLIIGLYQADTLERLKITGGAGQPGDDFLWLGDVEVESLSATGD